MRIQKIRNGMDNYLRSPKSPRPGMMYAFSFKPWSIQPVICQAECAVSDMEEYKVVKPCTYHP